MMQTKQILEDIAEAFAQTSNKNMIDLIKLREFVSKDKNVSENHIFMKKLKDLEQLDSISKLEFQKHFTPNVKNKKHFDYVFDSVDIDKSKNISKNQLSRINEDYKLNLTPQDIDIMISSVSKDKQRVKKQELYAFLSKE